jgi:Transposase DDE domain
MPEPYLLGRFAVEGETFITRGPYLVARFDSDDIGMRNLAVVALTDAGHSGTEVAACFGITAVYVSMLRGRARREGSAGLVRQRGRRPKLSPAQVSSARRWSAEGVTNVQIAARLGVHARTVGRVVDGGEGRGEQGSLEGVGEEGGSGHETPAATQDNDATSTSPGEGDGLAPIEASDVGPVAVAEGERPSRYAGAMLLHPFLSSLGAAEVFAAAGAGRASGYDDVAVLAAATFGFALGAGTVEAMKHLARQDAGAVVGLRALPELRTLRPRLGVIAERVDALALQRAFAKALVSAGDEENQVFFVDDHFVAYSGARPLAKGWNTKRRHAQRGRDDTFVVDLAGRAICFSSGEPSGLSKSIHGVVAELRAICGPDARLVLGFDRGGSYPVCFAKLRDAGVDWVTYRRGQPVEPAAAPRWSWFNLDGRRHSYRTADEIIDLDGYGPARQLSVYEGGNVAFQVLTSDTAATAARLVHLLRCRWRIENAFKYLTEHHGIDALCDYTMTVAADTSPVANPERATATATLRAAEAALADAERALGQAMAGPATSADYLATIGRLRDNVAIASDDVADAKADLKGVPARLTATEIDPTAQRATPRPERRTLQMVLRLLAYNAEHDLARRLNAYLADPDEYRAITRNLLHQGGRINYSAHAITVTIDAPNQPRVARALSLLADDLNSTNTHPLGDPRLIIYRVGAS